MIKQLPSLVGAFLVLAAYAFNTYEWSVSFVSNQTFYQLLNFVGGFCLSIGAIISRQVGLIILEVIWTLIAFFALI